MAERQVIKEKYRARGLFDFLHFPALLLLGDRLSLLLDYPDVSLFSISRHSISLSLPLSASRLAPVGIDPVLWEVFCVCNDVVGFVLTPYLSPGCGEGEHDLANVLPACQAVGGR